MKFKTVIAGIGRQARDFKDEKMLIFFGQCANGGLEDYSVLIKEPRETITICPGDVLTIGKNTYPVTAVGDKASETFSDLGHCTVRFDGAKEAVLPGTVHVKGDYPEYQVGDSVVIE
ncbi:PTS glucitol/sorbitol transporter subunit IIA [Anaerostipes sp.]|uniref:PTS glucitol/sorbitol transporter subunit IIA n=1 Tax=Anaerostipes sp. TaxID=1872530 RepID=UPI0025B7FB6A|nr:PTS glucitol/sorbitol transporter subunit IIA [Anaerostipes sp.]MBS7009683.1 PTS glucitol/sorbitol transporter subunit IIA [Anaerostipes sp.]